MHAQLGFDLETIRQHRKGFDEAARKHAVAGQDVLECLAEHRGEEARQHPVAGAVAGPVSGDRLIDAKAHHHVEVIVDQRVDHARGARGIVGRIAIDQHVDVGIDIGEHAPDHMPLALAALAAHDGAGRARDLDGAVL